jgi:hypothetical protein
MRRKKPTEGNEFFNQFMNILMYNKHIEETFFYKFEEEELEDIKNNEPEIAQLVDQIKNKMPYSFGFEMYFYDDVGYYIFKNMLNKSIGVDMDISEEINENEIESHFCFPFPIDKNSILVLGQEHFENLDKTKKEAVLIVTIYRPSALESLDEFLLEHQQDEQTQTKPKSNKRKTLEDLEKDLQDALKIEDYENCAKIQVKIDKIKNKVVKRPSKK